jgi:hypothetical protein
MVVFGSQCPNSDTDSVVESRDTWRVVQKRRFALTLPYRSHQPYSLLAVTSSHWMNRFLLFQLRQDKTCGWRRAVTCL